MTTHVRVAGLAGVFPARQQWGILSMAHRRMDEVWKRTGASWTPALVSVSSADLYCFLCAVHNMAAS